MPVLSKPPLRDRRGAHYVMFFGNDPPPDPPTPPGPLVSSRVEAQQRSDTHHRVDNSTRNETHPRTEAHRRVESHPKEDALGKEGGGGKSAPGVKGQVNGERSAHASPERRFPILGPTRQETELYFKTRKTVREDTKSSLSAQSREVTSVGVNGGKSAAERRSATFEPAQSALPQLLRTRSSSRSRSKVCRSGAGGRRTVSVNSEETGSEPAAVNVTDIHFLSDIVRPLSYNMRIKRSRNDKVIMPSKYGYHPRSHSPTFRRLVAAAELLTQYETSLEDPRVTMSSSEIFDFLNAKFVRRDNLEGGSHRKPPQPNTRGQHRGGEDRPGAGHFQHTRSKLLTASGNSLLQKQGLHQVELRIGPAQRRTAEDSAAMNRNGHPGVSTPDSEEDEDAMTNPAAGVTALRIEDNHTELHLFLPQLATSPSSLSKGGSVASPGSQAHSSPTRGHQSSSSAAMDSTLLPHIDNGRKNGSLTRQRSFGTQKCRSPQKRFRSPTKVFRDSSIKLGYSEPFERNENLREKLEDVPTLVSLDAES